MQEELIKYFKDNGVSQVWFSKQLGISYAWWWRLTRQTLSDSISLDMANRIEKLTNGKVTVQQMMERNPK